MSAAPFDCYAAPFLKERAAVSSSSNTLENCEQFGHLQQVADALAQAREFHDPPALRAVV